MTMHMTESQARKAGVPGTKRKPAHKPGEMNKTEAEYAQKLEMRKMAGEIIRWDFERFKIKLGNDCWFSPDFFVLPFGGPMELHEVKGGFIRDDAAVKIRVAADQFKCFKFILAQKKKGTWTVKEIR